VIADQTGLPLPLAKQVASGKLTIDDAVIRYQQDAEVNSLMEKHGLSQGDAFAVATGDLTVERALLAKGLRECKAYQRGRSVLRDLHASGEPAIFYAFGEPPFEACVNELGQYDVWLRPAAADAPEDDAPRKLPKHALKLVSCELSRDGLEELLHTDAEVAELSLGTSTSYRDRFRTSKRVLYGHHTDGIPTRVVLRDGTVLVGRVGWFGKWELELRLQAPDDTGQPPGEPSSAGSVVVFRHALYALEPAR
jgi:hypothetical protein